MSGSMKYITCGRSQGTITVARFGLHDFAIVGYPDATECLVWPPDEAYAAAVANVVKILTPLEVIRADATCCVSDKVGRKNAIALLIDGSTIDHRKKAGVIATAKGSC